MYLVEADVEVEARCEKALQQPAAAAGKRPKSN